MLLLIETWSAACCWFSDCTSCSMVRPVSASRCSIQVSGSASAGALALQAARELGDERRWSAAGPSAPCRRSRGSGSSGRSRRSSIIWSAQQSARSRSTRPAAMRAADAAQVLDQRQAQHDRDRPQLAQLQRRRPSGRRRRSGCRLSGSTRPSPCEIGLQRDVVDARQPGRRAARAGAAARGCSPCGRCRRAVRICSSIR